MGLLSRQRKLGWLPNHPDPRDHGFGTLGLSGVSTSLHEPILLSQWEPPVYDQDSFNSCVGESLAAAIEMLERQTFGMSELPSACQIYTVSRQMHTDSDERLVDVGTYPRLAAKAVASFGVARAEDWPRDKKHINRRVPYRIAAKSHGRRGAKYLFIRSTGPSLIDEILRALHVGYPVAFGTRVPRQYLDNDGPTIVTQPSPDDSFAGGHYQLIVGARSRGGRVEFRVRNSWGTDWRDGGYVWVDQDWITWFHSRDFMILYGWEAIREKRPDIRL